MSAQCLFWAIKHPVGDSMQKLVLIVMADIANEHRQCWPSHQYIADRAECSRSTVIRCVAQLEKKGLISRQRRAGDNGLKSSNVYTFPDVSGRNIDVSERNIDVSHRHGGSVTQTLGVVSQRHIILPLDTPTDTRRAKSARFTPPTVQEVREYIETRGSSIDPESFVDHYEANGWMRGKNKIKDWKACVRTWEKNQKPKETGMNYV